MVSQIPSEKDGLEKVEEYREELEYLAENGTHADWVAAALLELSRHA